MFIFIPFSSIGALALAEDTISLRFLEKYNGDRRSVSIRNLAGEDGTVPAAAQAAQAGQEADQAAFRAAYASDRLTRAINVMEFIAKELQYTIEKQGFRELVIAAIEVFDKPAINALFGVASPGEFPLGLLSAAQETVNGKPELQAFLHTYAPADVQRAGGAAAALALLAYVLADDNVFLAASLCDNGLDGLSALHHTLNQFTHQADHNTHNHELLSNKGFLEFIAIILAKAFNEVQGIATLGVLQASMERSAELTKARDIAQTHDLGFGSQVFLGTLSGISEMDDEGNPNGPNLPIFEDTAFILFAMELLNNVPFLEAFGIGYGHQDEDSFESDFIAGKAALEWQLKNLSIQYHIYHPNPDRFKQTLSQCVLLINGRLT